uniref:hypothetical protein n=1 Tax=Alicyclobacillus tolerans TaxID=90970 RepID=UPI001F324011|nr:hypothetical protein [Alicyclobacillus tolerans]
MSATAKLDLNRAQLFQSAIDALMLRYQEELGRQEVERFLTTWLASGVQPPNWRLHPKDSCWNQADHS